MGITSICMQTVSRHYLDVFARRIPTVRGYYCRFQTKSPWRQQTGSGFLQRSPCVGGDFPVVAKCLRLAQSVLTIWHTRDHSGKPLPVCYHHGGKRLKSTSPMWNSCNSSKNPERRTGNYSETPPPRFPMCPTCFLDGFRQSETGSIDYSPFPGWRQQTGSSYCADL